MKILHVKLQKGENKIRLLQNPIKTKIGNRVRIQRCFVSWSLKNIHSENNTIIKKNAGGETTVTIPVGYYSFEDLKKLLAKEDISIDYGKDNQITIFCATHSLILNNFGLLLGFERNEAITINTKVISQLQAQMSNYLKEIRISCSLLDEDSVFSYFEKDEIIQYKNSSLLLVLNIDTTQSLNGKYTAYDVIGSSLPCKNYTGQDIEFFVESGANKGDYEIYLAVEIV